MSFRGVGEGHRSSISFRTGLVSADGEITLDPREPFPMIGTARDGLFHRDVFHARLKAMGQDGESAAYVLDELPVVFSIEELEARLEILISEFDTRQDAHTIARHHRSIAACSYAVYFDEDVDYSERVLWPVMSAEAHGMEDARFVLFTETDGSTTYLATYTAFDGVHISQQLLRTDDFLSFDASPVVGAAAPNKGLALFPRRVNGQYAALTRYDRETNAVCFSDTLGHWGRAVTFQMPEWDWEVVQLGNCGSPIETSAGWLVLTHAVGPMRTYSIGAVLLDLDDPDQDDRGVERAAPHRLARGAGRLRAQRRLHLRRHGARRRPRHPLRGRRPSDQLRHRQHQGALEGDDRERSSDDRRQGSPSSHRGPSPRALSRRDLHSWVSVRRSRCRSDGA